MAIRERLRRTFRKKDGSSSGGSTPSTGSDPSEYSYTGRTDVEYYKPHEIPKSKYRGKVDPEHKERLEAYSFADAFSTLRRKSSQALSGIVSPGGTKSQSRRASYMSRGSRSARNSMSSAAGPPMFEKAFSRPAATAGLPAPMCLVRENSDDDTHPSNAGLSRQGTARQDAVMSSNIPEVRLERQATVPGSAIKPNVRGRPSYEQPFTADELEKAMTRASLRATDDGTLRNSMMIAAH